MHNKAPVLYLPHGGGPMPLLEDPAHRGLTQFLQELPQHFPRPQAIVLVSAHWEAVSASIYSGARHGMLYDYYGFPQESYRFNYPASGAPQLAQRLARLVESAGLGSALESARGFDHGMFVPLMLMYPQANIPCIQLSLIQGLDAGQHLLLGEALQELRQDNVAIIGSGMSFHNLGALFAEDVRAVTASNAFDDWLQNTMTGTFSGSARRQALEQWIQAPSARFCHPREEHLLPLHVCAGAAAFTEAELIFSQPLMGHRVSGFGWF